ncbi:sulfite exporter TauE/SafE family protein [candidate division KSB1 bacterium]|nr:sulfite exporter TauE/SafE family protein [candidate division KSB1 bacterium]NIR71151.1 sulfite exporter TauE/SafE family protein [candidate division KSB1 bacterium]NIS23281.1 sulfite exporter TauE/SafE family protein [candidate division KSB1 bacterium]NIT70159.1 sulfite exporter TauE/SafE family protein [candidate division KSB1 bacterium]NIU23811.1 sulfite exporter TauE/SafE family protein [candidate division KSB1 bacterium]
MNLEFWYMLPISVAIATVAMASGVEGATFFTPLFILALGLSPEVAIGTGLITEVFGFASGLFAYIHKRLIDYRLGGNLLLATIPLALLGTWAASFVEPVILKVILGVGLFVVAMSFLRSPKQEDIAWLESGIQDEYGDEKAETCLTTSDGEEICYTVCNRTEGRLIAGVGALFIGMISTGLGEMNGYFLLQRCRVPSKVSVATSVLVVAITALVASAGHFVKFVQVGGETLNTVLSLVIFTVPGVVIGGQLGSLVSSRISQHFLERTMGILFILVALLTLGEVIL